MADIGQPALGLFVLTCSMKAVCQAFLPFLIIAAPITISSEAILAGINDPANYQRSGLTITALGRYVQRKTPELARELVSRLVRGLKTEQRRDADAIKGVIAGIQTPVLTIPNGMESLVFYRME